MSDYNFFINVVQACPPFLYSLLLSEKRLGLPTFRQFAKSLDRERQMPTNEKREPERLTLLLECTKARVKPASEIEVAPGTYADGKRKQLGTHAVSSKEKQPVSSNRAFVKKFSLPHPEAAP